MGSLNQALISGMSGSLCCLALRGSLGLQTSGKHFQCRFGAFAPQPWRLVLRHPEIIEIHAAELGRKLERANGAAMGPRSQDEPMVPRGRFQYVVPGMRRVEHITSELLGDHSNCVVHAEGPGQ